MRKPVEEDKHNLSPTPSLILMTRNGLCNRVTLEFVNSGDEVLYEDFNYTSLARINILIYSWTAPHRRGKISAIRCTNPVMIARQRLLTPHQVKVRSIEINIFTL